MDSFTCDKLYSQEFQLLDPLRLMFVGVLLFEPVSTREPPFAANILVGLLANPAAIDIKILSTLSELSLQFLQASLNVIADLKFMAGNVIKLLHPYQV